MTAELVAPTSLSVARRALAEADTLPDVHHLVDYAEAAKVAARRAGLSEEAQRDWSVYSLEAQRKAGQLLAAMPKHNGRPENGSTVAPLREVLDAKTDAEAKHKSKRWQDVAAVPDEVFHGYVNNAKEITRSQLLKTSRRVAVVVNEAVAPPDGQYQTFVVDPPWQYSNTSTRGAAQNHYSTMTIEELCALPVVPDRATDTSHLYLWTTAGHLPDAFQVITAWGFDYKTYLVWVKPQMGMGNYFRVSTELVLFATRGDTRTRHRGLRNHFTANRGAHSAKPTVFHDLVAEASPGPYLELFSRCNREDMLHGCQCSKCRLGWDTWGAQS